MAIKPQDEATDHNKTHPGIRHKRVWINETRGDKAARIRIFKPKDTPRRQRKGEKSVPRVGTTEGSNGPEEDVRLRGISAELNGNPEDACSCNKPQEGQARQFAIDTDASINRFVQCISGHLPYGMMQPSSGPGRILDQNPQHHGSKERSGSFDLLDRNRMPFPSYDHRNLVHDNQPGDQTPIHPPSEAFIATEPKWTPR